MTFSIKTRYGAKESFPASADIEQVVRKLVAELETEQFDEPDDEHTEIAIGNGDLSMTVHVSGLVRLTSLRGITGSEADHRPTERFIRAQSKSQVLDLLARLAMGRLDEVVSAGWLPFDKLPPHRQDLFRK